LTDPERHPSTHRNRRQATKDEQPELVLDAIRDVVQAVWAGDLVPH
jgi:hypothetical protein